MRKRKIVSILLALSASKFLYANNSATTAKPLASLNSLKVCVVNIQSAILQTNDGKAAKSKIEKEATKDRENILKKQNDLKSLEAEFQKSHSLWNDSEKMAKQKEFQEKFQEYQKLQVNFEQQTRNKELAATQEIFLKIVNVVKKTRKQEKCSLAFDSSAGVLLDADEVADITAKIIEKYNSEYKVKG